MHEEERDKGPVTVSSLPTKEDFIEGKAAACRAVLRPNEVTFLRLAGFLLVLSGFVLRVFLAVNFYCLIWCAAARRPTTTAIWNGCWRRP